MKLIKKEFPANVMRLTNIFSNKKIENFTMMGINSAKVKDVYGTELNFPEPPKNRPYIYGSFVQTIDGKLAYEDAPGAFEVAGRNHYAGTGGLTDFWWLQVLRSSCDALIIGAKSMQIEHDYTGHSWDQDLEDSRVANGMQKIPYNIVVSTDASDIPFDHMLLTNHDIPSIISCAPAGKALIQQKIGDKCLILDLNRAVSAEEAKQSIEQTNQGKTLVLISGEAFSPSFPVMLEVLRQMGIKKLMIESPTIAHLLIKAECFDEGFINQSCVYIGGNATSLGKFDEAFTSVYHPHTEVLSVAMHSPHMFFFRHKFLYGIETK